MTMKDLEKVLYCESYVVIDPGSTPFTMGEILSEERYRRRRRLRRGPHAGMGAEAIRGS